MIVDPGTGSPFRGVSSHGPEVLASRYRRVRGLGTILPCDASLRVQAPSVPAFAGGHVTCCSRDLAALGGQRWVRGRPTASFWVGEARLLRKQTTSRPAGLARDGARADRGLPRPMGPAPTEPRSASQAPFAPSSEEAKAVDREVIL